VGETEWQAYLAEQYQVLRQRGPSSLHGRLLEPAGGEFTSARVAASAVRLETKFDSGTGWPSFFAPVAPMGGGKTDKSCGGRK
jgi:peptide-methionine (R)-S-oxide reductase